MRKFSRGVLSALVAVTALLAFTTVASAFQLPVIAPVASRQFRAATATTDPNLAAGEADSASIVVPALVTSTGPDTSVWLSTSDWSWNGADQAPGTSSNTVVPCVFHFTVASPGACDSVTFQIQGSFDGQNAVGGMVGTAATAIAATGTSGDKYFRCPIVTTISSAANTGIYGVPFVRVITFGDTGGKQGGLKIACEYWRQSAFIPAARQ